MRNIAVVASTSIVLLAGCGTYNTLVRDDHIAKRNLKEAETYCDFIPRIYSGVAYDFCELHSKPSYYQSSSSTPDPISHASPSPFYSPIAYVLADLALSGVLDTAALPYTIYRQSTEGSIELD